MTKQAAERELTENPELAGHSEQSEFTGHQAVDAAVRAVANASELPVREQVAAYEAAHHTLREVLENIEE